MGFLDEVTVPGNPTATPQKQSSFVSSVTLPKNPAKANKIAEITQQAEASRQAANEASSLSGLFKNTISGITTPLIEGAKKYVSDSVQQVKDVVAKQKSDPMFIPNAIGRLPETLTHSIADAASASFNEAVDAATIKPGDNLNPAHATADNVARLAKIASGVAGVLFSPISGTFSAAEKVPVLKQVADAINIPFTVSGLAASYGTGKIFDIIPDSIMSQETKDIVKQPIQDLSSVAAQVFIGGRVMDKITNIVKRGGTVTKAEAENIVNEVKTEHAPVIAESLVPPAERNTRLTHQEYARAQGYEPYVPPENLPTIQFGPKAAASDLPVIQADAPAARVPKVPGDFTIEPIPEILKPVETAAKAAPTVESFVQDTKLTPEQTTSLQTRTNTTTPDSALTKFYEEAKQEKLKEPVGNGDTQISKLAKSVNRDAIRTGLREGLGELPEYSRMSMTEQANLAAEFIRQQPDHALAVALGEAPSPVPHLLAESVYTAMRITAREARDVEMLRRLAIESQLVSNATSLGQRIKALDSGAPLDPVSVMQDIKESRQRNAESKKKGTIEKTKKAIASEIKVELKKAVSKRPAWEEFIKEVQCKY